MTTTMMRGLNGRVLAAVMAGVLLAALTVAGDASAQARRARPADPGPPAERAATDPAELARLFDAYAVMRAQETLGLDDAQFGQFVTRLRALQQMRRRHFRERAVLLRELRQLVRTPATEAALKEKTQALAELEQRIWTDEHTARQAIDEVLDVRQRARFRLLEQQLEQRKLELVNRVRARQRPPRP